MVNYIIDQMLFTLDYFKNSSHKRTLENVSVECGIRHCQNLLVQISSYVIGSSFLILPFPVVYYQIFVSLINKLRTLNMNLLLPLITVPYHIIHYIKRVILTLLSVCIYFNCCIHSLNYAKYSRLKSIAIIFSLLSTVCPSANGVLHTGNNLSYLHWNIDTYTGTFKQIPYSMPKFTPPDKNRPCRYFYRDDVETSALLADYVLIGWPIEIYRRRFGPQYDISLFVTEILKSQAKSQFPVRVDRLVRVGPFSIYPDAGRCLIDVKKDRQYIFFLDCQSQDNEETSIISFTIFLMAKC